jgi:hypothetical protein
MPPTQSHLCAASPCRTLSLDNILLLLSCVLRECQVLVLCPILSKLSSCLLGLLPLLQPFAWHHLHLPVVPLAPLALQPGQPPRVLGFQLLQATCPFLLGFPVTDQEALFAMCEVRAAWLLLDPALCRARTNLTTPCLDIHVVMCEVKAAWLLPWLDDGCPDTGCRVCPCQSRACASCGAPLHASLPARMRTLTSLARTSAPLSAGFGAV